MSDQPVQPTTPSNASLDDILNQLEKATGTTTNPAPGNPSPMVSSTPAMPTETAPVAPPEPTPQPEAAPAPVEPAPAPQAETPVATLAEKPIVAPEPTAAPAAPAPVMAEEPMIDKQKAVVAEAPPEMPATPAPAEAPAKKSAPMGKIVVGIVGVLLLAGVAGIGVYASRQQQNTESNAYIAPTPLPQTAQTLPTDTSSSDAPIVPEATPATAIANEVAADRVRVSGKVCTDTAGAPGFITLLNTDLKVSGIIPISQGDTTYQSNFPVGNVYVYYVSSDTKQYAGYTDATTHALKPIKLASGQTFTTIDVCDAQMDATTIPSGTDTYKLAP